CSGCVPFWLARWSPFGLTFTAGVARPADNAASGPPRANETRSCGQSPASGRWPISKGLWRTTLEPSTHPHLCTSRLLLLVEFGAGVLQRWGFFIPVILRNMFPAVLSILAPAITRSEEADAVEGDIQWVQLGRRDRQDAMRMTEDSAVRIHIGRAIVEVRPGFDPVLLRGVVKVLLGSC